MELNDRITENRINKNEKNKQGKKRLLKAEKVRRILGKRQRKEPG